jgi:molecular chaperone DnaK
MNFTRMTSVAIGILAMTVGAAQAQQGQGITKDEIKRAFSNPHPINMDRVYAQQARRMLLDLETKVLELEADGRWPELEERALDDLAWAAPLIANDGTEAEQKLFDDAIGGINRARKARSIKDLERHRRVVRRIGNAAFFRDPSAWVLVFENYASHVHAASDLQRAQQLVIEGRRHVESGDHKALRAVCDQLVELLPVSAQERARAYASGLR